MEIKEFAHAKINLMLDIRGKLPDGYHSIYTIMQTVGLYDEIYVKKCDGGIAVSCSDSNIPNGQGNIAYKAAENFFSYISNSSADAEIYIEKNIPHGAGLGGGSADAAAVIRALDKLYETGLSARELCLIGEKTGSDVPFCITGGTALCLDTGQVIAPLPPFPPYYMVIVKPPLSVSAAEAYAAYDKKGYIRHPDNERLLNAAVRGDYAEFFKYSANVFEQVIDIPERVDIKDKMRGNGALFTCMTGSGSAVYGIFENKQDAEACICTLKKRYEHVYPTGSV
ncbi:MAG: 4-(cytidine 5'-diphospho)-2-C-methyl-D-erythritol kinase [Oscillospiraceae bacterium]|nr:4-(cytidine 5'-diphospho)-2-C-methyl-D-erythritol kinase [Oscillospiraceae bacterium]